MDKADPLLHNDTLLQTTTPEEGVTVMYQRLLLRYRQAQQTLGAVPQYGVPTTPDIDIDDAQWRMLSLRLKRLSDINSPPISAVLGESPATQLPLIGALWKRLRKTAHSLPLFYVQVYARFTLPRKRLIAALLNQLTARILRQRAELAHLRAEAAALREHQ
jgi:hypothetical protein